MTVNLGITIHMTGDRIDRVETGPFAEPLDVVIERAQARWRRTEYTSISQQMLVEAMRLVRERMMQRRAR